MSSSPARLFGNNAAWAARMLQSDGRFFARLQAPEYLWIGCSDMGFAAARPDEVEPAYRRAVCRNADPH
jgi:carbonic anhydrase